MKKIYLYFVLVILICFLIPIIFTDINKDNENQNSENNAVQNEVTKSTYNYKDYNTIKLLHKDTSKVEEIKLDEYLYGVVSAEMPASFEEEALKAQAVVARTYTIYKIIHNKGKHGDKDADICDDSTCCQAWISKDDRLNKWKDEEREENWNKIVNAVNNTQGKIILYNGEPINAFFHSNSGGTTEAPLDVWGGSGYPYLQAVETSGEDAYSQYASSKKVSKKEFEEIIKKEHSDFKIDFSQKDCMKIEEYTDGNRVKKIKIGNLEFSGVEVRSLFGLRSANFKITIESDNIKFEVTGYGHGVGMSQTGADSLAKQGYNYEDIIKHFYIGVEIKDM